MGQKIDRLKAWWDRHELKIAVPIAILSAIAMLVWLYMTAGIAPIIYMLIDLVIIMGILALALWKVSRDNANERRRIQEEIQSNR